MPLECGASNVSNQVIRVNIARIGRTKTNETTEGYNNRIKGRKGRISMDKVTIEVLHLDKTSRMKVRKFHHACGRWHAQGQCWSDGQNYGCNNCGGRHSTEECRQPDSSGSGTNQGMNPQHNARENTQGMRLQGVNTNEHVQTNIYYDQTNARHQFQPPVGGRLNNGYAPNQNGPVNHQPAGNGRQVPPHKPGPTNTQDVRFMEGNAEPQTNDPSTSQAMPMECRNQQWTSNANAITYELRGGYEGTTCEELAMAVTTRAMRGSAPAEAE